MTFFAATACLLAASLLPYASLRAKCLVAACAAAAFADVVLVIFFSESWFGYAYLAQTLAATASIAFYWMRPYGQPSDEILPDYVYLLRKRPVKFQDFVISMCGFFGTNGGYSIYVNGNLWGFKNGVFISRPFSNPSPRDYHITRGALVDRPALEALEGAVGRRWSLFRNCVATINEIWEKIHGRVS